MPRWRQRVRRNSLRVRFWAKVNPDGDCWEWTGARNEKRGGYGAFAVKVGRRKLAIPAHRIAYLLEVGDVPDGWMVLHCCDNPPCVRPDHLFLGLALHNTADMIAKGRMQPGDHAGVRNGRARLTPSDVLAIRELLTKGVYQQEIAYRFGITQSTVSNISVRKTWAHL